MSLQLKPLHIDIQEIDRKQLAEVRRRFMAINRHRISRIRNDSGRNMRLVLDAIPVLLHVNHPALPGYSSQKTPCAISDFTPSKMQITSARKISRSFNYKKKARLKRDIFSVFLMGSMGTLGQSNDSDLDIWVVHQPNLKPEALKSLQKKLSAIEKWASDFSLSVHFFLMAPDYFIQQQESNLEKENCGSTQHLLLLEEFYRTALLLAGRYPLWWLVPPQQEDNYESFTNNLIIKRFLRAADWIDFGGVPSLPVEEYFGATLWHLNKAIDSPYKSNLKMMLMEAYAASYPKLDPVCLQFKKNVFDGKVDDLSIDPYALILQRIEINLNNNHETHRIEWARKCLYLKAGKKLSIKPRGQLKIWRRQLMQQLVTNWGWDAAKIKQLDQRKSWKIIETIEERKAVIRELTQSYRFMSQFARKHGANLLISSEDMTLLGRKLQANFERRAEKIERVNPGISADISEREMTFYEVTTAGKPSTWSMYHGKLTEPERKRTKPIFKHKELMGLFSWGYLNGLIIPSTQIQLLVKNNLISATRLRQIYRLLKQRFPVPKQSATLEAYHSIAIPELNLYLINLNSHSEQSVSQQKIANLNIVTNRNDPLGFGSKRENLIFSVDVLTRNSWHEVSYRRYYGEAAVLRLLQDAFQNKLKNPNWKYNLCDASNKNTATIEKRLTTLVDSMLEIKQQNIPARFIWSQGKSFHLLGITENVIEPCMFDSEKDLFKILGFAEAADQFVYTSFDVNCCVDNPLQIISKNAAHGKLNIYFETQKNKIKIWLSDEIGAIGFGQQQFDNKQALLRTYQIFFSCIAQRQKIKNPDHCLDQVEYFDLLKTTAGWESKLISNMDNSLPLNFYPVQALIEDSDNQSANSNIKTEQISIYCGDTLISGFDEGENLFKKIAKLIKKQRKGNSQYPIYITDLDLSALQINGPSSTIRYLEYKWLLEKRLNEAIH